MPMLHHRSVANRSWGTEAAGSGWPDDHRPDWLTDAAWALIEAGGKVLRDGRVYWLTTFQNVSTGDEPKGKPVPIGDLEVPVYQPALFDSGAALAVSA